MQCPVHPEKLLTLYPEYILPEDQKKAWLTDRTCAIVGRQTADRFGFKVGDRIPIQATIWRKKDNSASWEFNLCGIYDGDKKGVDTTPFFFNYEYFDEARQFGQGQVGLVRHPHRRPRRRARDRGAHRRAVRQLLRGDEDDDGEGVRAGVREAGGRHRRDHPRHRHRRVLHDPPGGGQHDGPVGARADRRTGRPEDAGLLGRPGARARAHRVVRHRGARRRHRPGPGVDRHPGRRPDGRPAPGVLPAHRRPRAGRALRPRARAWWRASCRPFRPCACASWMR